MYVFTDKYKIVTTQSYTVQFINGNQIINLYDAVGHKYRSITYIVPETAVTSRYEIMQYGFDVDTIDYLVTEYAGTIENHYSRIDTTRRIHNAIGYYANNAYYHYIKDHLGNICAVVHSVADTLVQSTMYYASCVPMSQSDGRDRQPYLYNGKEFIEAHGLNTYDYGFRGYYAPIGRFTSIDPLTEQTPWQSPYSYAGNRFVNAIDWMGLAVWNINNGSSATWDEVLKSFIENQTLNYTELNNDGTVKEHRDDGDHSVWCNEVEIGTEIDGENYKKGRRVFFRHNKLGIIKIYNYSGGQWVHRYTPWDQRVAIWLRAKKVDKIENRLLEIERPIVQEIVLLINPELGIYNSISIVSTNESIYGQNTDNVDRAFAIVNLLTFGAGKIMTLNEVADGIKMLNNISNVASSVYSIKQDYETKSQENH